MIKEENHLGLTREQLATLDRYISRLSEIMVRHVELMNKLRANGQPTERASMILATHKDLITAYIAHRQTVTAALADAVC